MKRAVLLALAIACGNATAQSTPGENLHRATLREWHQASSADQLAMVAGVVERILDVHDPVAVASKARGVQACVNRVSENFKLRSQMVADTAVACIAELGYLPR